ncbi:hypothetical protein DAC16_6 [Bacteroides phage DAC16]|nr:hypothetical protein DAC16_6 [Bacteroides phage DAC16]
MKKLQKGDVVRIKSIEWYNKFNKNGIIFFGRSTFNKNMSKYCGQLATVEEIRDFCIKIDIDEGRFFWDSRFFEEELLISKKLDEEVFNNREEEISNEEALKLVEEMKKEEKESFKIEEKVEEDKVTSVKKKRGRKPGSKNKPKVIKDESKNSNDISIVNFSFEKEDKFKNFKVTKEQLKEEVERNNIDSEFILKEDFSEKEENFSDLLEEYILEKNLSYREGMLLKSILNKDIINFKKFKDYEIIQSKG